jgi:hypothetical protein
MQLIYISNRPENLADTVLYVEAFLSFIDDILVFCPDSLVGDFKALGGLKVFDESTLLLNNPGTHGGQEVIDHQKRNYLLRAGLARHPEVAEVFIMSDDDSRPIVPISQTYYLENGLYHSYYFYTLEKWRKMVMKLPTQTSYDIGHMEELRLLNAHRMNTLMFSSHMPQIIDKQLLGESVDYFADELNQYQSIDEWGAYFNYSQTRHPDRFHEPKVFRTLAWPESPYQWPWMVPPSSFDFENFYPSLYQPDGLFHGLDNRYHPHRHLAQTLLKVRRYTEQYTKANLKRSAEKKLVALSNTNFATQRAAEKGKWSYRDKIITYLQKWGLF